MVNYIKCPHCGSHIEFGMSVCSGCQGEVIKGFTKYELRRISCSFALMGLVSSVVIMKHLGTLSHADSGLSLLVVAFVIYTISPILLTSFYGKLRVLRSYKFK